MSRPAHPGTVRFVDELAKTERVEPVEQVPEAVAFATVAGVQVPVVKVVLSGSPARRELRRYGQDGTLLESTYEHSRR